ncbi:carboxymuconolactone decarboxylase family protein [Roseisalinus antarcticus]|uniref:Carboxymuconolactone decarboxylase-like domain-containing protein n=1 Tax=Roseisalinus antarcticus TaxID=254357 RepID=A0A1Y5U233_9RHOB|nr:carboxymuconolactone decarboxylase family protein [Roseisalinus antarcticus]SLN76796.1 hypothetical protein ROA7023_04243 [Roseisalinus antarcticus]
MTSDPARRPRPTGPDFDALSPDQARVAAAIKSGPRGDVVGPLRLWLISPQMAELAQALGQYARYDSVLPPDLSELAILVTARYWSSGFEWAQHAPIALAAGLPAEVVDAIAVGARPELTGALAAVLDLAVELHRDKRVSDATYAAAEDLLGEQAVVDLVAICGYYTLISMTINAFELPDGTGPVLPPTQLSPHEMFRD